MPALEVSPVVGLLTVLGAGNVVQWVLSRPGQKKGEQQAMINSMISAAQATPALVKQAQDLLTANAALQSTIFDQKNTAERLTDRVEALEKDVKGLTVRCEELTRQADRVPALEARVGELEQAVRDRDATIRERDTAIAALQGTLAERDRTAAELDSMLQAASLGQQMAEGVARQASAQTDRLLTTLCPPPDPKP